MIYINKLIKAIKQYYQIKKINILDINLELIIQDYIFNNTNMSLLSYINSLLIFDIPKFDHNNKRDEFYRLQCDKINISDINYTNKWNQYKKIESLPQPEQKSPLWFEMRNNFITASAGAQAIGESKYEKPIELIKQKIGLGKPFGENSNVHHGKKFEKIAILIYENIYNNKVGEFGLIPHISEPQISFLGASPDGICTCSTLDGKFSSMVGRMLEIKCVTSRKINTSGDEDGVICPHYYWVQVQLQLECCDLEECDFWQCKLKDYWSVSTWQDVIEEYELEENSWKYTEQQNRIKKIDNKLTYGTLIELLPLAIEIPQDHKIEWYGKYIYPIDLTNSIQDKINWAQDMKLTWKEKYPEYAKEYKFGRILYWHLEQSHCYLIQRDRAWFANNLYKFQAFWDQVEKYKNDPIAKQQLIDEIAREENKKQERLSIKKNIVNKTCDQMFDSDSD